MEFPLISLTLLNTNYQASSRFSLFLWLLFNASFWCALCPQMHPVCQQEDDSIFSLAKQSWYMDEVLKVTLNLSISATQGHRRLMFTSGGVVTWTGRPACMSLDCGRKPKYPEGTHANTRDRANSKTSQDQAEKLNPGPSCWASQWGFGENWLISAKGHYSGDPRVSSTSSRSHNTSQGDRQAEGWRTG